LVAGGATPASQISLGLDFLESSQNRSPASEPPYRIPSFFIRDTTVLHLGHRFLLAVASNLMPIVLLETTIIDSLDSLS
jgi:hypothetical protein